MVRMLERGMGNERASSSGEEKELDLVLPLVSWLVSELGLASVEQSGSGKEWMTAPK